jgi:hypothetical protein
MVKCLQETEKRAMMATLKMGTVAQINVLLNICGHAHKMRVSCQFAHLLLAETENLTLMRNAMILIF